MTTGEFRHEDETPPEVSKLLKSMGVALSLTVSVTEDAIDASLMVDRNLKPEHAMQVLMMAMAQMGAEASRVHARLMSVTTKAREV